MECRGPPPTRDGNCKRVGLANDDDHDLLHLQICSVFIEHLIICFSVASFQEKREAFKINKQNDSNLKSSEINNLVIFPPPTHQLQELACQKGMLILQNLESVKQLKLNNQVVSLRSQFFQCMMA